MPDNDINEFLNHEGKVTPPEPTHYYGDLVRKLFMFGAIVMLIGLPFFHDIIPISVGLSLIAILAIGIAAGLVNPKHTWVMVLNALIALVALFSFEYYAVNSYIKHQSYFFVGNQLLALVFLFALYYAVKTVRGKLNQ